MVFLIASLPPLSIIAIIMGCLYFILNFNPEKLFIQIGFIIGPLLLIYPYGLTSLAIRYYPEETGKALSIKQGAHFFSSREKEEISDLITQSPFVKIEKDYAFLYNKETIASPVTYSVYLKNDHNEYDLIHSEVCDKKIYPEEKYPKIHGKCYQMLLVKFVSLNNTK